jgi:hypothetical protein
VGVCECEVPPLSLFLLLSAIVLDVHTSDASIAPGKG